MNKKDLTERDICTKFITPAVQQAGWDPMAQIREQVYFTKGRIIVRGKLVTRGKGGTMRPLALKLAAHEFALSECWTDNPPRTARTQPTGGGPGR